MHALIKGDCAKVIVLITIMILGSSLGNISQTALNAMFSGMAQDFGVGVELSQWVTTLYMLVLGITVPVVTYLMKRFSVKHVVLAALAFLLAGSLLDYVAWDFISLMVGRALQAVSAGIMMPMMMSLIMTSFPRDKQATVMGIAGIAMGFAPNIGPTIGGWMIGFAGWRSFFIVLSVCTLVLLVLAILCIDSGKVTDKNAKLDTLSLILSAVAFGSLLIGFSNASSYGFESAFVWLPIILGAAVLAWFIQRQRRIDNPLISMDIFKSARFTASFWAGNVLFASYLGITLILPLFVENVWGGTALEAGLSLLPSTIAALAINPLAGYLTDKIGARPVLVASSLFLAVGAVSMIFLDETSPFWLIMLLQGIRAVGVSGLIGPISSWGMSDLPHTVMTDGSSFSTAVRQASGSLGTALMVFLVTLGTTSFGSMLFGYQLAFAASGVFAIATFAILVAKGK